MGGGGGSNLPYISASGGSLSTGSHSSAGNLPLTLHSWQSSGVSTFTINDITGSGEGVIYVWAWGAAGGNGGNENGDYDTAAAVNGIGGRTNPNSSSRGQNGVDGTGSGGGACTHDTSADSPAGGDGGDGVVIIRYAI